MPESPDEFDDLCARICRETGWERLPNGIRVAWQDGRHQLVALEVFHQEDRHYVRFCSRIGPVDDLDEDRLVSALRVNAGLTRGALAVMHDALVLLETEPLHDLEPDDVVELVDFLASTADGYEKTLFRTDAY
jgi:hypothetical protein